MVPAAPGAALEVVQAEAVLEFAVVVFDAPAHLGPPDQVGDWGGGGQVRYPVVRRSVLAVRPFHQQGLGGQHSVPPVAAAARLLGSAATRLENKPESEDLAGVVADDVAAQPAEVQAELRALAEALRSALAAEGRASSIDNRITVIASGAGAMAAGRDLNIGSIGTSPGKT